MFHAEICGRQFLICTKRTDEDEHFLGEWYAWCFFAYDSSVNIYPADSVPKAVVTQESIVGGFGDTELAARQAVEEVLRRVSITGKLDGTGFYSPPGGFTYPHECFPPESLRNETE